MTTEHVWAENSEAQLAAIADWLGSGSLNIFGLPLAGKDTQSARLSKKLHAAIVGGGDILRTGKGIPDEVRKEVNKGKLAPTDFFRNLMAAYLSRSEYDNKPLILSAVGRWHGEEPSILEAAESAGHPVKAVILLQLDETTIRQRWHKHHQEGSDRGRRVDDDAAALELRLQEFRNKTTPVIEFYRERNMLVEVEGIGAPKEVETRIVAKLYQKAMAKN